MIRHRLAQVAVILAAGIVIVMTGVWMVAGRGDHPLFQRVIIAPGNDPSVIPITVEGAHLIEIDRTGALLVHVGTHVTRQPSPRAYQDIGGVRRDVSVHFEIAPAGDPRFVIGPYDHASPLVIESQPGKNERDLDDNPH